MRITIFGANGKVGSLVVEKALKEGLQVVAFSHGKTTFGANHDLRVVQGDIYSIDDVDKAIKGSDVVISALGSWGTPNKDVLTAGMKNIIPSMRKYGIKRIISLTGADAAMEGDRRTAVHKLSHLFISLVAKKIVQDGERHIQLLKESDLDWTVLRSPVMNEKGEPRKFKVTSKKPAPWATINRKSVAQSLIEQIRDDGHIQGAPYIKRT